MISYPSGGLISFTEYVPFVKIPEVTVPSLPVVSVNVSPFGAVTSNTASAKQ